MNLAEETRPRRTPHAKEDREAVLAALSVTGNVTVACERTHVPRRTVYQWKQDDPEFAAAFADVLVEATERLEFEARRRAEMGVDKPVWYQGEMVGTEKQYSDTLMIQLLKAHHPAHQQTVTHRIGGIEGAPPVSVKHTVPIEDMIETLRIIEEVSNAEGE